MRKLLKGKKALSPVVAAIIMIAVTVAVSIAVAAWMGALTFTFMKTEELKITTVSFSGGDATQFAAAEISFRNTGASSITLADILVDDADPTSHDAPGTYAKGEASSLTVTMNFTKGVKYTFALLSTSGNKYTYTVTAAPG